MKFQWNGNSPPSYVILSAYVIILSGNNNLFAYKEEISTNITFLTTYIILHAREQCAISNSNCGGCGFGNTCRRREIVAADPACQHRFVICEIDYLLSDKLLSRLETRASFLAGYLAPFAPHVVTYY
jgi:hypothetical protein